jgi:hypothetical protein
MPRNNAPRTSTHVEPAPVAGPVSPAMGAVVLTSAQLARWADLLAREQLEFPQGLAQTQEEELRTQVRRLRRDRLVQFIAQAIAGELSRKAGPFRKR